MRADPASDPVGGSPPVVVREVVSLDDQEAVLELRDEVFVREQQLTDDARHDPDDRTSIHFLAEIDGRPVGTGRITLFGREAQVAWVAVRSAWRGAGIGKAVMEAIIERSRHEGADHILLNAQTHAIGFYEQLGFETVGTEFVMGGIGHRVMVLRL